MNEIEQTPTESKWHQVTLAYKNNPSPDRIDMLVHRKTLVAVKDLMDKLGFRLNLDYMFSGSYNYDKLIILLDPKLKEYESWIVLNWEPNT